MVVFHILLANDTHQTDQYKQNPKFAQFNFQAVVPLRNENIQAVK